MDDKSVMFVLWQSLVVVVKFLPGIEIFSIIFLCLTRYKKLTAEVLFVEVASTMNTFLFYLS